MGQNQHDRDHALVVELCGGCLKGHAIEIVLTPSAGNGERLFDLDHHFDLDGCAEWERHDADGRPRVSARGAKDLVEKRRATVDNQRLLAEFGGRTNKRDYFDHAHNPVEGTESVAKRAQTSQRRCACGLLPSRDVNVRAQSAANYLTIHEGDVPGHKHK